MMGNGKRNAAFYQSKFDYYRSMNMWVAVACSISSLFYVVSDWYLFGGVNMITVPARMAILVPFAAFLIVNARIRDYRIVVPMSYLLAHSIMWCTIWACADLPDLTYASDGFIVIMSVFIFFGVAAPAKWGIVFTGLVFADIAVANTFLHYPEFAMMLILGVPFYFGICMVVWAVERTYSYQYELKKKLEESAFHDQLTGIYNRNIIDTITGKDRSFTCFHGKNIGVLLIDIDFFKRVNDTFGHDGGDVVLKEVVAIALSRMDMPHYMIRWGGEEFLIILEGTAELAAQTAETICRAVEQESGQICPVTISIGVAQYLPGDYNDTVRRADRALYRAKDNGRNQIVADAAIDAAEDGTTGEGAADKQ